MRKLQPGKMNVSLVAHYGKKPEKITELIEEIQSKLLEVLGDAFSPYPMLQVHGTIIGLEGFIKRGELINANYLELQNTLRPVDFERALNIIKTTEFLPFDLLIGGYIDGENYSFTSQGLSPYLRSFSIQGTVAVAIGWPYENGKFINNLDGLRRQFNKANILHKYHNEKNSVDNDFFFVLGNVVPEKLDNIQLRKAQSCLRSFLAEHEPVVVPVTKNALSVVAYVDKKLPIETTSPYTVDEAINNISEILSQYEIR